MTNEELLEDLLIEFDELDMQPMLMVPNPLERAKAWKHELTYAIEHLKAEIAREIIQEVADFLWQGESERLNIAFGDHYYGKQEFIAELKKKYIGEQK